ncbi:INTRON-ENCODED HOMING ENDONUCLEASE putative-RELATED [Salix viminalis]|uniref:INTRON-ENCODED HOMING ENDONUCLEASE putative-RELATED n=1 Tax=Salix viminalis TaxID=40686 RepID=A0A9Q0SB12_SALVM|nr:INTRON-ENCODED HOMING ENDONUCLEASE putative-RELATED [Salix viminalis]
MINSGQSGAFVFHSRGEILGFMKDEQPRKAFAKDVFINQERKLGARRRSDTVLVSTINDADQGLADVAFRTPPAPYEKSKFLGSGGSMVARLKLKGIDGRAPPGVEPAA